MIYRNKNLIYKAVASLILRRLLQLRYLQVIRNLYNSYLLDMPHGFTWKGVYVDADLRTVETVGAQFTAPSQSSVGQASRLSEFMQLSALQGSILENRIFEDDFQVESISTAKLITLANSNQVQVLSIDATNINTLLSALPFDENIKDDIVNSVNQGLIIKIPQSELTYEDWTGVGYIKENPETGESGWMLSGMIAGGMTAWGIDKWPEYYLSRLINPYSEPPNLDPLSAKYIQKITKTDLQNGTVGEKLPQPLQVLVHDNKMKPVKGALVTFTTKAGGGNLEGKDASGKQITGATITVPTDLKGIASVRLMLGQKTSVNPTFWWEEGYTYTQQVGENIVDASLPSGTSISKPFSSLGFPNTETASMRQTNGNGTKGLILSFTGFIALAIEDNYGNPISNIPVEFLSLNAIDKSTCSNPNADTTRNYALLVKTDNPCIKNAPTWGECGDPATQNKVNIITDSTGAAAEVILGGVPEAEYPIKASAVVTTASGAKTLETAFNLYTYPFGNCDGNQEASNQLFIQYVYTADAYGHNIDAGKTGTTIPVTAKIFYLKEGETEKETTLNCSAGTLTCKKIIGNRQYSIDTNFKASTITFAGQPAASQGNGIFTANYTLSSGLNTISINGTAAIGIKKTRMLCPSTCENLDEDFTQSSSATMKVYGVDININPTPIILTDEYGYTKQDYMINYTILPLEYQSLTAYVMLYKNGELITAIPAETKGQGIATISRGFQFDISSKYEAEIVLNYGTGVEIRSGRVPLKVILFKIIKPTENEKILIKNDNDGNPKMQPLTAQVELKGSGVEPSLLDLTNKKICWQFKVEYVVNITKKNAEYRSRKGLNCNDYGVCDGKDGYFIPAPDPNNPENGCKTGSTFIIDAAGNNGAKWDDSNFGGGTLSITAKTDIDGTPVYDTYIGAIQGQKSGDNNADELIDIKFKEYVCKYLEAPTGVQNYQSEILDVLGHNKVFRIISYHESAHTYAHFERLSDGNWKNLGSVLGYSSDYVFPLLNKGGTWSNPYSDGGFGLMQLTIPAPSYLQIWNWKENINGGVKLIKDKLSIAKNDLKKHPPSTDSVGKSILRMETFFRYGPTYKDIKAYWTWDEDQNAWVFSTEDWLYADTLRAIEDAVDAGNYKLTDPDMRNWKYTGE